MQTFNNKITLNLGSGAEVKVFVARISVASVD